MISRVIFRWGGEEESESERERERERKREIEIESEKERTREKEKKRETMMLHVQYTAVPSDTQLTPVSPYPSIFTTKPCSPLGKRNTFWVGDCYRDSVSAVSHMSKRTAPGTSLNYIEINYHSTGTRPCKVVCQDVSRCSARSINHT